MMWVVALNFVRQFVSDMLEPDSVNKLFHVTCNIAL